MMTMISSFASPLNDGSLSLGRFKVRVAVFEITEDDCSGLVSVDWMVRVEEEEEDDDD